MKDMFTLAEEAIAEWEAEDGLHLLIGDRERLAAHVVLAISADFGRMVDRLEARFLAAAQSQVAGG